VSNACHCFILPQLNDSKHQKRKSIPRPTRRMSNFIQRKTMKSKESVGEYHLNSQGLQTKSVL